MVTSHRIAYVLRNARIISDKTECKIAPNSSALFDNVKIRVEHKLCINIVITGRCSFQTVFIFGNCISYGVYACIQCVRKYSTSKLAKFFVYSASSSNLSVYRA